MPIQRSILSAFCLLFLGSASALGQADDPFAAWDRQKSKSTPARENQASPKPSLTYFSASPASEKPTETVKEAATPAAQVRMRERSAASPIPSPEANAPKGAGQPGGADKIPQTISKKPAPATKPAAEVAAPSSVQRAAFEPPSEGEVNNQILKVSQPGPSLAEEENPFASYLKKAKKSETPAEEQGSFPGLTEEAAAENEAEAIFGVSGDSNAGTKPPAKAAPAPGRAASRRSADDGPQSPGVTVQWVRRGDFNVGQECSVDLVIQNTSKTVVRSVMTEAIIPAAVEVVQSTPGPVQDSDTPMWTFGELQPGETRTVSLKVIPHQRGDVRLDAFVRLTGFSSTEFSVQEPMIQVAVAGPEKVEVGQQLAYVVRVNNPGTGVASNVVIQAAVPEGLEHRSGSLLSIEIGTLAPGESRQARLNLAAISGGQHELAVRAIADGGLGQETMAKVSVAEPKLNIAIAGPTEQLAGRTGDFRLTISNAGNVQSSNVRAKYRIPEGFEYAAADRGGKYNKVDHSVEWFVGTLQPGESSDFQMSLKAVATGELLHQAGVVSEHGQVTLCDYSTTVEGVAALDLKIVADRKELKKGDDVTWTVRIRNTGSRPASNVGMSCELPSGIQLINAEGPSEYIAENGVMVFRSMPSIAAGATVEFRVTAHCTREGNHRLRLRVASESISEPLIGEESAMVTGR